MTIPSLVIASHNASKIEEFQHALAPLGWSITSASALKLPDVDETGATFTENALLKAHATAKATKMMALADDSGLVIPALDDFPGVMTARYTKQMGGYEEGARDLLNRAGADETPAAYICVLALVMPDGTEHVFEGRIDGTLSWPRKGDGTFGYDPWFTPKGETHRFAEMNLTEKQALSHRGKALAALLAHFSS